MNNQIIKFLSFLMITAMLVACSGSNADDGHGHTDAEHEAVGHQGHVHDEEALQEVHLSDLKFESLGIRVDTLPTRAMSGVVHANGELTVPPQHEAMVTAIIGGNVTSIKVLEGDKVHEGQVLAYLAHPDFSTVQANYIKAFNESHFLEKEFQRQQRMYDEEIGSGQKFQEVESKYKSLQAEVKSYESQLKQLGLDIATIREGKFYEEVPVSSPIDGYIEKVLIQIGQYVAPTTAMVTIMNTKHIHADFMVFEKDIAKVKVGQTISFTVESAGSDPLTAKIYSVGKKFEQNPKAVHIHAEIDQKKEYLIPGMYIKGKIQVNDNAITALPESAIVEDEGKPFIFRAERHEEDGEMEWAFSPVEIRTGMSNEGWVEIKLLEPLPAGTLLAWSGAYYLMSEMKKGQNEHSH